MKKSGTNISEKRPKIKVELTYWDKIAEVSGWTILAFQWIITIVSFSKLPESIPIHFNYKGEVDNYGDKLTILFLPIISTILFVSMTFMSGFLHVLNYPIKITIENALSQYSNASKLIRFLKLIILILFTWIEYSIIQVAFGKSKGLGVWFLPVFIGLIFIPLAYFIVNSFKNK